LKWNSLKIILIINMFRKKARKKSQITLNLCESQHKLDLFQVLKTKFITY
jgi:hypothetical protein